MIIVQWGVNNFLDDFSSDYSDFLPEEVRKNFSIILLSGHEGCGDPECDFEMYCHGLLSGGIKIWGTQEITYTLCPGDYVIQVSEEEFVRVKRKFFEDSKFFNLVKDKIISC